MILPTEAPFIGDGSSVSAFEPRRADLHRDVDEGTVDGRVLLHDSQADVELSGKSEPGARP